MRAFDLTHIISNDMPVYPGTRPPSVTIDSSIEQAGYLEHRLALCSHTGTHIDAPAHLIKGHNTLDNLPIDHFQGPALLIDLAGRADKAITRTQLQPFFEQIREVDFLLLHTGWSRYWGVAQYFTGYPVLSEEAAQWLSGLKLKGIGVDAISVDREDSNNYPIHHLLLQHNMILIENLANLGYLSCDRFLFCCFPLRYQEADGSPVRAVAFIQ